MSAPSPLWCRMKEEDFGAVAGLSAANALYLAGSRNREPHSTEPCRRQVSAHAGDDRAADLAHD
jgi:hypothetical protein